MPRPIAVCSFAAMLGVAACAASGSAAPPSVPIAVAVSYKDPPRALSPATFASVRLSAPPQGGVGGAVAVTPSGVVVVDPQHANMVTVVDWADRVGPWLTLAATTQVIGYAGTAGSPVTDPDAVTVTIDEHNTVTRAGTTSWSLRIDRDPAWTPPFEGRTPAAPSSDGGAVHWTTIGRPTEPAADYPDTTLPVVAELRADGTGSWWSLPDGWQVAASDTSGTVLARATPDGLTLARFRPA